MLSVNMISSRRGRESCRGLLAGFMIALFVYSVLVHTSSVQASPTTRHLNRAGDVKTTSGLYWFQVGAWAAGKNGYSDSFGIPITGASVEIRIKSQSLTHNDTRLFYWVGLNLPNDAFVQVGYELDMRNSGGKPTWFWEYFMPGTATQGTKGSFLGGIGHAIGPNGTWVKFSLTSNGTVWSALVNRDIVGSVDLSTPDSGTNGPYASAEVAAAAEADNVLGPVEFRNLSYRDINMAWHSASAGVSLCCYSAGSNELGGLAYPYGVAGIPGEDDHWLAGSGLPISKPGQYLWPWYRVTVSSPFGIARGSGIYLYNSPVTPKAESEIQTSSVEKAVLKGWLLNGNLTSLNYEFTAKEEMNLTALYTKQYLVTVTSDRGTPIGSGWYDNGSTATISVNPTSIVSEGMLGQLGARYVLSGWIGDFHGAVDSKGKSSVLVDSPKTIHAVWSTNYGIILPGIIALTVLVLASLIFVEKSRRKIQLNQL